MSVQLLSQIGRAVALLGVRVIFSEMRPITENGQAPRVKVVCTCPRRRG